MDNTKLNKSADTNPSTAKPFNKVEANQKRLSFQWKRISSMIKTIENQFVQQTEDVVADST